MTDSSGESLTEGLDNTRRSYRILDNSNRFTYWRYRNIKQVPYFRKSIDKILSDHCSKTKEEIDFLFIVNEENHEGYLFSNDNKLNRIFKNLTRKVPIRTGKPHKNHYDWLNSHPREVKTVSVYPNFYYEYPTGLASSDFIPNFLVVSELNPETITSEKLFNFFKKFSSTSNKLYPIIHYSPENTRAEVEFHPDTYDAQMCLVLVQCTPYSDLDTLQIDKTNPFSILAAAEVEEESSDSVTDSNTLIKCELKVAYYD